MKDRLYKSQELTEEAADPNFVDINEAIKKYGTIEGKIIRLPVNKKGNIVPYMRSDLVNNFVYGRAIGGFGCKKSLGTAIFVQYPYAKSPAEVKKLEATDINKKESRTERWERNYPRLEVYMED